MQGVKEKALELLASGKEMCIRDRVDINKQKAFGEALDIYQGCLLYTSFFNRAIEADGNEGTVLNANATISFIGTDEMCIRDSCRAVVRREGIPRYENGGVDDDGAERGDLRGADGHRPWTLHAASYAHPHAGTHPCGLAALSAHLRARSSVRLFL